MSHGGMAAIHYEGFNQISHFCAQKILLILMKLAIFLRQKILLIFFPFG